MANVKKKNEVIIKESEYASLAEKTEGTNYIIVSDSDVTKVIRKVIYATGREFIDENSSGVDDKYFVYSNDAGVDTWDILHNLNKMPSVSVVDSNNNIVDGSIEYIDDNRLIIHFNYPFNGKVYLN